MFDPLTDQSTWHLASDSVQPPLSKVAAESVVQMPGRQRPKDDHVRTVCLSRFPGSPTAGEVERRHSAFRTSAQVSRALVNMTLRWHVEDISKGVSAHASPHGWTGRRCAQDGKEILARCLEDLPRGDLARPLVILFSSSERP